MKALAHCAQSFGPAEQIRQASREPSTVAGTTLPPPACSTASKPQASVSRTGVSSTAASSATWDIASCRDGTASSEAAR